MPRKSAAALLMLDPRGHRLQPPRGLSKAERLAFVAAVRSVRPSHFAAEDVTLFPFWPLEDRALTIATTHSDADPPSKL